MDGARGVLLMLAGGSDLGLFEVNEAADVITQAAHPEANIIFGAVIDDSLGDEVKVTVIAAGFDKYATQEEEDAAAQEEAASAAVAEPARPAPVEPPRHAPLIEASPEPVADDEPDEVFTPEMRRDTVVDVSETADADDELDVPSFLR